MTVDPLIVERLGDLIEARSGIYIDASRRDYIARDVAARMERCGLKGPDEYLALVAGEAGRAELDQLLDLATNNETYFFREPNHFRALQNHILPALVAQRRTAITIWSAGCSTGEEPYSIAMSVLKVASFLRGASVKVLGTDLSARTIERARLGHYGRHSFRGISDSDLKTFFVHRARYWEVKELVKELCDLRVMNLLEAPGDSYFDGLDVIFCRNVTIYFREETIRALNRRLTNSLRDGGYLIFGASETLQHQHEGLSLIEVEGSFLYRKGHPVPGEQLPVSTARKEVPSSGRMQRSLVASSAPRTVSQVAAIEPRRPAPPPLDDRYVCCLALVREERYDDAVPVLRQLATSGSSTEHRLNALALLANIFINREDFAAALKLLTQGIAEAPLRADLYLLLGLALRYQQDEPGALARLKKAAFIQPDSYLTHFHLAEIYRALGHSADATREYRNTLRLLRERRQEPPDSLLVATAGFPPDYLVRVCERHAAG